MKNLHYQDKSIHYGMGHTRRDRILKLAGNISGKSVLDVGCASGYLGKIFKERGASFVAGIEVSETAAKKASETIDRVWSFDIEDDWPQDLKSIKFDVINISEVLEHVFNPVSVLKSTVPLLKEDGRIIITTPNFMTWTNRLRFIFGDFEYKDQGMFDFGHIRWFTYKYLNKVLKDSGLEIEDEKHIIFPNKLNFILKYWPSLFAWQFVLKAKKL